MKQSLLKKYMWVYEVHMLRMCAQSKICNVQKISASDKYENVKINNTNDVRTTKT